MTGSGVLAALAGAGVGLGVTLVLAGLLRAERRPWLHAWLARPGRSKAERDPSTSATSSGARGDRLRRRWRIAATAGAAALAGVATGWPVVAVLAAAGVWWLPGLLGPDRAHAASVARIEGVAGWAEQLRDTLAAASGLEQAITTTAVTAPEVVRPAVAALAERIHAGERLPVALARAGHDIADPTGDLVIAALTLAAQQQARQLGELLAALAAAAREEAAGRMRTAVARARVRTSVRVIIGATLGLAAVLAVLNSAYLAPYSTLEGQVVLAGVGALFAVAFGWLARIARPQPLPRLVPSLEANT